MHRRRTLGLAVDGCVGALGDCLTDVATDGFSEEFQPGAGDWETGAAIGPEVDLPAFDWSVAVSNAEAHTATVAAQFWSESVDPVPR